MTKFVACKCPNCGANIKVDAKLEKGECKYCGADVLVERDMDQEIKKNINDQIKFGNKMSKVVFVIVITMFIVITGCIIFFNIKGFGNSSSSDVNKNSFNLPYEYSIGTHPTDMIKVELNEIIKSNKKYKKHQIYVEYEDKNTNNPDEIVVIRDSLNDNKFHIAEYDVMTDYDKDGYINKYTITKTE